MDILIVTNFTYDFSENDNDRFLYIAKLLSHDHNVEIVTSDFYHTTKKKRTKAAAEWPFRVTFLHELGYKKNVCIKRFVSHYIWGLNVIKYVKTREKPDVIYCAIPSLTAASFLSRYCKTKGIRFIVDLQDLWPESFKMVFDIPVISDMLFLPFAILEHNTLAKADEVCGVSQTYIEFARKYNTTCKGVPVFLGCDLRDFDNYKNKKPRMTKPSDEIWIGYCGTLGSSYDLPCVIDALKRGKKDNVKLIVMGDGPLRNNFKQYAQNEGISSIFLGRMPYEEMCSQLCQCDIVVNPIVGKSVASIINKHADYAASGKPVVNNQNSDEYKKLIENYNMGLNCENGNSEEMNKCFTKLISDYSLRQEMGANARRCAEDLFDRSKSYASLVNVIVEGLN